MAKIKEAEIVKIKRSQISLADYNPREISKDAKKRLQNGLEKYGLVSTLVWNKRTGTLVSGHQRLSIMDEKNGGNDYEITVSAVDLSPKEEAELNVQMNNVSMMGDFDIDKLNDMVKNLDVDINNLGFSDYELDVLFGDEGGELERKLADIDQVKEDKGILEDIKKERAEMNKEKAEENSAEFYFVVVCDSESTRTKILTRLGVPITEEYVSSAPIVDALNL